MNIGSNTGLRSQWEQYDACLWWTLDNPCNLDCTYCCAVRIAPANPPIHTDKLLLTLTQTGKTFRLHFSSNGEPFLTPGFVDTLQAVTRHHYVSFNTNLTARCIPEFVLRARVDKVLEIVGSLHIEELERRGLTARYIENFHLLHDAGFPVRAQVVAHPDLLPELARWREWFGDQGIDFTCNHFIGKHRGKEYPADYTPEEVDIFGHNIGVGPAWRHQLGNPCNAGLNIAVVRPDGVVTRCYDVKERLGHIYEAIDFGETVVPCPSQTCACALNRMDEALARAAGLGLAQPDARGR